MMKKYISNTTISISAMLPNAKSVRISFTPRTDGSSIFYTSDNDIQHALEHHYKFGKLFRLAEESKDENQIAKRPKKTTAPKPGQKADKSKGTPMSVTSSTITPDENSSGINNEDNNISDAESSEYLEVVVSDMDAAKDYLAEKFDVVRTKLKTEDSIREAALAFGIEFKYL